GMGDGDRLVRQPACGGFGGNGIARDLVVRFTLGPVVDDQREPARLRFADIVEADLRAGPEGRRHFAEIAHDAVVSPVSRARRLRLIMLSTSTPTEKPIAT